MKMKLITLIMAFSMGFTNLTVSQNKELKSTEDTLSYCLGISIANSLKSQNIKGLNSKLIAQSIDNVFNNKDLLITKDKAELFLRDYFTKMQSVVLEENKAKAGKNIEEANKFLEANKKKKGVVELPSGLQYIVLKDGSGESPIETSKVKTHYEGSLINGEVFDGSYERGEPIEFPVNGVIKGWTEALLLMKPGSKWRLFIPPHLAYGEKGAGGKIPPNAALIFIIELLEVINE